MIRVFITCISSTSDFRSMIFFLAPDGPRLDRLLSTSSLTSCSPCSTTRQSCFSCRKKESPFMVQCPVTVVTGVSSTAVTQSTMPRRSWIFLLLLQKLVIETKYNTTTETLLEALRSYSICFICLCLDCCW